MSDTTNINALPSQAGGNIQLETKEIRRGPPQGATAGPPPTHKAPPIMMNTNMANKIVTGIQNAAETGATSLPSRDVPMMPQQYTQDPRIKPNYVPPAAPAKSNYIQDPDSIHNMITKNKKKELQGERLETIYDEMQVPILVMVLFLLFQLPIFQRTLKNQLPSLFAKDGHATFGGYLFKTFIFGASFYLIQKGAQYLSHMG